MKTVKFAHAIGVSVEAELGVLGSLETMKGDKEDGHGAEGTMTREQLLTDPDQAADFVKQTNCDALAIAIGTSHGAYKFTKKPTGDILAIDRIKEIHARIPNTHLVMHGSSSVPQELLAEIREFGGDMKETYGVPVEEIVKGIAHGVRKVNIDTDIRLAMTGAIRRYLFENPGKFDPRDYLKPAREAAKKICLARFEAFGCAGRASQIKVDAARQDGRTLRQGRAEPDRQISPVFPVDRNSRPRAAVVFSDRQSCSQSNAGSLRSRCCNAKTRPALAMTRKGAPKSQNTSGTAKKKARMPTANIWPALLRRRATASGERLWCASDSGTLTMNTT